MGDPKGFLKVKREKTQYRPVMERLKDYGQVAVLRADTKTQEQASRCMDCGTPFCHSGCPLGNLIPEWNDLAYRGQWERALGLLSGTNNFPEVTGRVCPALCEYACVLGLNDDAVSVRENELGIVEHGFRHGLIKAVKPAKRTGKKVAVIGSGPAGLSCADQLNKAGHKVTVFERDDRIGGLLRYGIPDFKLEKHVLDRRIAVWKQEGIVFKTKTAVGKDHKAGILLKDFDAVCLAGGAREARDLKAEGRGLKGIEFALDYLSQANRIVAGDKISEGKSISAKGKKVVVIGGGDTGSDCVGTANRQGAASVVQIEVLSKPPECRTDAMPWPRYPMLLKTTSSHEEGSDRHWSVATKRFVGVDGAVKQLECVKVEFVKDDKGCPQMKEIAGSAFTLEADLVLLAVGFVGPEREGLLQDLKLELDPRGNVKTGADHMTSRKGVFCAGDMRRGQSLVVWAISEGRKAARAIDEYLQGSSSLPVM